MERLPEQGFAVRAVQAALQTCSKRVAGNPLVLNITSDVMTRFALGALALIAVGVLSNAIEATRAADGSRGLRHGLVTLALLFLLLLIGRDRTTNRHQRPQRRKTG